MTHFIISIVLSLLPLAPISTYSSGNDANISQVLQVLQQVSHQVLQQKTQISQHNAQAESKNIYVTPKGRRYHYIDCRALTRSKAVITINMKNATQSGYTACRTCKPILTHRQNSASTLEPIYVDTHIQKSTKKKLTQAHTSAQRKTLPPRPLLPSWQGLCVGVSDGDTITVLRNGKTPIKIRLYGIDTPEKKQAFGMKAKLYTSGLVFQQIIHVQTIDIDRYNREVAIITLPDSSLLQTKILENGMAWVYTKYCSAKFRSQWQALEEKSKNQKLGLWQDKNAIAPWQWRKNKREHAKREKIKKLNRQNKAQAHILNLKYKSNILDKNIQKSQVVSF